MKTYRTTTSDEDIFHVFDAEDDYSAGIKAEELCLEDGVDCWNIEELNDDYEPIRTVC